MSAEPAPATDWWGLLRDPAHLANPYPALGRIREQGPVQRDPVTGIYFVLGHSEFGQLAKAPAMGRDTRLWQAGWNTPENRARDPEGHALFSEFHPQMTNVDGGEHRRMRDVYEKAFRPASLARLMPMMTAETDRLLDTLPAAGPVEFMSAFANPLAGMVSLRAFGLPVDMADQVAEWVAALSLVGNVLISPDEKRNAHAALRAFKAYLRGRLATDTDGFIGLTRAALDAGTLDKEEALTNLVTLVAGGTAIATLLGNGLLALLRHPDQFARLRAERALLRPAIEEMLRFEPGGSFILRVATTAQTCGGVEIPAGSLAIGLVAAMNRDPAAFADPDRFAIDRQPNGHHVFGVGPHVCIGKALVRMSAQAAFTALLDRFPRIALAGEPVWWTHRSDQHGLHALPLHLERTT